MEIYEEKYKDLVKRLNKAREEKGVYTFNSVLDAVAPELKIEESEDERIRKSLKDCFEWLRDDARWTDVYGSSFERVFAWLEKQGSQQLCMIQWKGYNLKEVIGFTGKDKNFDKWFASFEEYEKYVHEHNNIFKLFNEDGSHYEVPVGAWIVKTPDGYNTASRYVFRQKLAWSKEDREYMKSLLDIINGTPSLTPSEVECHKDWLKSLRPQSQWRPSDEQMDALEKECIAHSNYELCRLLEQLKKLKE